MPGGGIEHFEESENALKRELQEEVGVNIDAIANNRLQAWTTYDLEDDRPLLFLAYPVHTKTEATTSPSPDITIGYFMKHDLKILAIEPHLEKFRQHLIDFAPEIQR